MTGRERGSASYTTILQFERVVRDANDLNEVRNRPGILGRLLNRLLLIYLDHAKAPSPQLARKDRRGPQKGYFSILLGPEFQKCLPHFLTRMNNSIYIFDAWPQWHDLIASYLPILNIRTVFFSSLQSTRAFRERQTGVNCVWIPEGVDLEAYESRPYPEKDIDVLQYGRKYDLLHRAIAAELPAAGRTYLYEKEKGSLVFPNRLDFIDGMARTKVSICVPASITDPERAGTISTMTHRYLESMAARCLVLGILPDDMKLMFDYNPIIDVDLNDPVGQINCILDAFQDYIPLIEKNYRVLREGHTWRQRWEQIRPYLVR